MQALLIPPVAFLIYFALLYALRRRGQTTTSRESTIYGSGEAPAVGRAFPGYRPFFVFALFFAALHLGALVLASSTVNTTAWLYLLGLAVVLLALLFE